MATTKETLNREITVQAEQFDEIFTSDEPFEALWDAPLDVTTRTQLVVLLCTGGPNVEAIADLDSAGVVVSARIEGSWGSEKQNRSVNSGSSLWRALQEYAETTMLLA